jgi:hypothetical protein
MLCPYGIKKGDLKLRDSAPSNCRNLRKLVSKYSFPYVWQGSLVNAEPAVATIVVSSSCVLKSYEEMLTSRSQLLNTLGREYARAI